MKTKDIDVTDPYNKGLVDALKIINQHSQSGANHVDYTISHTLIDDRKLQPVRDKIKQLVITPPTHPVKEPIPVNCLHATCPNCGNDVDVIPADGTVITRYPVKEGEDIYELRINGEWRKVYEHHYLHSINNGREGRITPIRAEEPVKEAPADVIGSYPTFEENQIAQMEFINGSDWKDRHMAVKEGEGGTNIQFTTEVQCAAVEYYDSHWKSEQEPHVPTEPVIEGYCQGYEDGYNKQSQQTAAAIEELKQVSDKIKQLQVKYDENGYDLNPLIQLQRIEQHIDAGFEIWANRFKTQKDELEELKAENEKLSKKLNEARYFIEGCLDNSGLTVDKSFVQLILNKLTPINHEPPTK